MPAACICFRPAQPALRGLDRTAILGRDARGGAMALMVSTEMAQWQADRVAKQ